MAKNALTIVALSAIVVAAVLSMHGLALRNGTADYRAGFNKPGAYLPDTKIAIQARKTGVEKLDEYVALMLSIFWVDLDPRNVVAHIQGSHFLGTLSSAWLILLVEAHRVDASASFLIRTYAFELVGELVGLGIFTPLWSILQLASLSKGKPRRISKRDSLILPIALVLGHVVPTALMTHTQPDGEGVYSQQVWVLVRLFHPALTLGIWQALRLLSPKSTATVSLRGWYSTAIVVSAVLHAVSLAPVILQFLSPGYIDKSVAKQLDVKAIIIPAPFWTAEPAKVASFAQGVSQFLQWDEIMAALGIVTWAFSHYVQSGAFSDGHGFAPATLAHLGFLLALGGPGAAAAYMLQETDRIETEKLAAGSAVASALAVKADASKKKR